ncbi:ABC transporter ATP-binding protein [Caldinitratiruptor microaerophilus]|uniref:ABC transporter ATP-binding protein n=1 Tax=Caldinitratiruptor microaerophilus TaxID=671077 RepID=UPI003872B93D
MLEVSNLEVRYGDVSALRGISLRVEEGEIVSIVGANGAGKTTLINTLSGLLKPSGGSIRFLGQDITDTEPHDRVPMGIVQVPEGRRLFPLMTVMENLLLGSHAPSARAKREETLGWVFKLLPRLEERKGQIARTLSGGEQQMVAIGRALMSQPKLLMLDEPSLGLAPAIVEQIFDLIRQISREGVTVLLVEQNVHHSLELSHRGYVLEHGSIVLEGTGRELLGNDHVRKAYLGM